MKAQDGKGEALQQLFEHGDEEGLADPLAARDPLVLGDAVHGVDVVEAFDAVLIALDSTLSTGR